ncbi:DUF3052 family protein [Agromyces soli]
MRDDGRAARRVRAADADPGRVHRTVRSIAEKLQIKPGDAVAFDGATAHEYALVGPLPDGASTVGPGDGPDAAVLFARDRAQLDELLAAAAPRLAGTRAVWIAYPKGNRSDINRDRIWSRVQEVGWTLNANVSIDETWSAVRMKPIA